MMKSGYIYYKKEQKSIDFTALFIHVLFILLSYFFKNSASFESRAFKHGFRNNRISNTGND